MPEGGSFSGIFAFAATNKIVRALALDVGTRSIGLALSDEGGVLASAIGVLDRQGQVVDVERVLARAEAEGAGWIVVGMPLELDGREGHRVRLVRRFIDALEAALREKNPEGGGIRLDFWDERFSTSAAERSLIEADVSRAKRKEKVDAVAAQFILQGWLDARRRAEERQAPQGEGAP